MIYLTRRLLTLPLAMLGLSALVVTVTRFAQTRTNAAGSFSLDLAGISEHYGTWLRDAAAGNFGLSAIYGKPVVELIAAHLPLTLELALLSMAVALCCGVPLGVLAATRKSTALIIRSGALMAQSTPSFVIALVVAYAFRSQVRLPMEEIATLGQDPPAHLSAVALPALSLGLSLTAAIARAVHCAMMRAMSEDYMRAARSRGLSRRHIVWRHIVPNSLPLLLKIGSVRIGSFLAATALIEEVFGLPGFGRLLLNAVQQGDQALVQASMLCLALLVILVGLVADLLRVMLDRRIRLAGDR